MSCHTGAIFAYALTMGLALVMPRAVMTAADSVPPSAAADEGSAYSRDRIPFNMGWSFQKGDPPGTADQLSYLTNPLAKRAVLASVTSSGLGQEDAALGGSVAWTQPSFDDTGWRRLTLPHDWAIEGPFDIRAPGETAKLPHGK